MPRTCSNDGSNKPDYQLTIRRTHSGRPASRIFWKMTAPLRPLSESPATPTAARRNSTTAAVRRFCTKTWRGFGIEDQRLLLSTVRFNRRPAHVKHQQTTIESDSHDAKRLR